VESAEARPVRKRPCDPLRVLGVEEGNLRAKRRTRVSSAQEEPTPDKSVRLAKAILKPLGDLVIGVLSLPPRFVDELLWWRDGGGDEATRLASGRD